jgi:hypothetical protein
MNSTKDTSCRIVVSLVLGAALAACAQAHEAPQASPANSANLADQNPATAGSQGHGAAATPDYSFAALDTNHDGKLSRSEIPLGLMRVRSDFATFDLNRDNALSQSEYAQANPAQLRTAGNLPNMANEASKGAKFVHAPDLSALHNKSTQ